MSKTSEQGTQFRRIETVQDEDGVRRRPVIAPDWDAINREHQSRVLHPDGHRYLRASEVKNMTPISTGTKGR